MARAPNATKWPIRAPPTKSRSAMSSVYNIETERSGSSAASTSSRPITTRKGTSPFVRRRSVSPFLHDEHRHPDDDAELAELRRLERAAEEKALRAVDARRDRIGQHERERHRHDREPHQRPRPLAPLVGVDLRDDGERDGARRRAGELPQQIERARAILVHRHEGARAVEHRQAEGEQHRAHEHEPCASGPCASACARRARSVGRAPALARRPPSRATPPLTLPRVRRPRLTPMLPS